MRAASLYSFPILLALTAACTPSAAPAPVPAPAVVPVVAPAPPKPADTTKVDPYAKLIPASAITKHGLFDTHLVGEKLYFEIPRRALDKEMLLIGRFDHSPEGGGGGGAGGTRFASRTLRWERRGTRIILRSPLDITIADSTLPVYKSVIASSEAPIIAIFTVDAWGKDSAAVIDVTKLYTTAVPEFVSLRGQIDAQRSYVERALAFPDNVEVEAQQTITPPPVGAPVPGAPPPPALSVLAHWSMVVLPDRPMMARLVDERTGFIAIQQKVDYGTNQQRSVTRSYIARFRLEKKDPAAAKSDPVKPIVYWIDPAMPNELKPWARKAVRDWQPAFEAAGFTNAIIPMDPPPGDSEWSLEDTRHTVVRWIASQTQNAYAEVTGLQDPRSGETLNGSVFIYHNVMRLARNWYFTQVGHLNPAAQQVPFPDSLMGRLMEFVIAHEIGHALGLNHDQLGSALYPADSVRSKTWVHRMGHAPSIMDYARFNYVAQPEDGIDLEDLIPRIGPWDLYSIRWGYTPISGARTPDDERPTLDRWAMEQDAAPWLRWAIDGTRSTPAEYSEAVGDADATWSTGWGVKNLQRIIKLVPRMAIRPGQDNSELEELYTGPSGVLGQWRLEMGHVAAVVGGTSLYPKSGSQPGPVYTPNSRKRQADAVKFLNENAFKTPTWLIVPEFASRFEPSGMVTRINGAQSGILGTLLTSRRIDRLIDFAARSPRDAYTVADLTADLHHGIWTELSASTVTIDVYRRALQSSYLTQMDRLLHPPAPPPGIPAQFLDPPLPSDGVAAVRGDLTSLRAEAHAAIPKAADTMTRMHLQAVESRIGDILEPKK